MLTYNFENIDEPIYLYLYKRIKQDIISGNIKPGEKLPSKRTFARNNGISTITIQNAYDQLISEGYVYSITKKGYYVAEIDSLTTVPSNANIKYDIHIPLKTEYAYDFTKNSVNTDNFPFSIWTRISRYVMSTMEKELMDVSDTAGVLPLRESISEHLKSFRGMLVDPNQIIIGAGTEQLYGYIIELLGNDKKYVIENPGYKKLSKIYASRGIQCAYASIDSSGMTAQALEDSQAQIAHICPNHHFPTGVTMPASRRYDILSWANADAHRYIVEDDYDSEFRIEGKPIPTLFSIDACEKVIYMNTFSKSLSPTIRISYMVLPVHLANLFYKKLSFHSCPVSNFEQYTLSKFISEGYFEKHINRMRLHYNRKRKFIINLIEKSYFGNICTITDCDAGLHFLIKVATEKKDHEIIEQLKLIGIRINALSDYYFDDTKNTQHVFIVNYSNLTDQQIVEAVKKINALVK